MNNEINKPNSSTPAPAPVPPSVASSATPSPKPASDTKSPPKWAIPAAIFSIAILLFILIEQNWVSWEGFGSVKTDDAYVRADIAPLSTKVISIVKSTNVSDFQTVKAGQLLVELKNDDYKAHVEQAQSALRQAEIALADMKQKKEIQDARIADAKAALAVARADAGQADNSINIAVESIKEATATITAARAGVTQSSLERRRQESLLAEESATKQQVENVVATHDKADSELTASIAQLSKAKQQLLISKSNKEKSLQQIISRQSELLSQIKQRELLNGEEEQLQADVAAKKAGLTATLVDLDYTYIRAPQNGIVGELKVKPGQLVGIGTNVISLVSAVPWVIANYREVQLSHVRPGDTATIQIDAIPGKSYKGHVETIAPASDAEFSLLPPENATGNFTKVTQRIPVRIVFDENQESLALLRPGMSVVSTIHTR